MTKFKHMTLSDRNDIQIGIERKETFKAIALTIGKDPSTISKEVRKHLTVKVSHLDEYEIKNCTECPLLKKAPYVCNACPRKNRRCGYPKQFYYAKQAHKQYEDLLVEAREGIALNKEAFYQMDDLITKKIKDGQHLEHILRSNDFDVSRATIYRYLHDGYLSVKPIDFPRVAKFKERKKRKLPPIPRKEKIGRLYDDFLAFKEEHELHSYLEMDTVIGRIGGKCLLTFDVTFCNFMFACLLDDKSAFEVAQKLYTLKDIFHDKGESFSRTFPLILTDNGGEFARIDDIESDHEDSLNLFFCDPNRSDQKAKVEKNHTLVRDILPKGTSFDNLTQEDINLVMSHVNSVKRAAYGGKTAYELFVFTFGKKIANLLGITEIPANDVVQSPKLLKGKID